MYQPLERIEVSIEESSSSDSQPKQDGPGQVEGGVEVGRARVELDESQPSLTGLFKNKLVCVGVPVIQVKLCSGVGLNSLYFRRQHNQYFILERIIHQRSNQKIELSKETIHI